MALHVAQMGEQRFRKGIATGKAREAREAFEPVAIGRQCVGLLVRNHLQAIFDRAQEAIGGAEIIARLLADPSALGEHVERRAASPCCAVRDGGRRQ